MKPTKYKVHLEPNLQNFVFDGFAEIEIETEEPTSEIPLNSFGLAIWSSRYEFF